MKLTPEQLAIVDFVHLRRDNLVVEALPGTGKTSTLLAALPYSPQKSILIAAFNRRIVNEISEKLKAIEIPRTHVVHVRTLNQLGWSVLRAYYPKLEVNKEASEALLEGTGVPFKLRWTAVKLLRAFKETAAVGPLQPHLYQRSVGDAPGSIHDVSPQVPGLRTQAPYSATLLQLGWELDIFNLKMSDAHIMSVIEGVRIAYTKSMDFADPTRTEVDFCDQVWAPLILNLKPKSRYQAIYVDELQDISEPQFALLQRLLAPGGRFVGIGDPHQQIYSWRGSMGKKVWQWCQADVEHGGFAAKTLPLTLNFRCALPVIREAQRIVPQLRGMPDNDGGSCEWIGLHELPHKLAQGPSEKIHTFVLSRTNRDLLDTALYLWREDVKFTLNAGRDMLSPVLDLLDALLARTPMHHSRAAGAGKLDPRYHFKLALDGWLRQELEKAEKRGSVAYAERVREYHAMLDRALEYVKTPSSIRDLLGSILVENNTGVLLSTVHKVKGLEADRVFLLAQTFRFQSYLRAIHEPKTTDYCSACGESPESGSHMPHGRCVYVDPRIETTANLDLPAEEECNIELVAITRAREHLTWVDITNRSQVGAMRDAELAAFERDFEQRAKLTDVAELQRLHDFAERELTRLGAIPGKAEIAEALADKANKLLEEIRRRSTRKG